MGVLIVTIFVAFVPALLYVLLFRLLDVYEKEPLWLVSIAFVWGAIPAAIIAIIGEVVGSIAYSALVSADPDQVGAVGAAVLAPLMEELGKGLFLAILFFAFRRQIDSPLDGLVIGATVGLGFAATENVIYLFGSYADGGTSALVFTAVLRIVVLGFGHALFTGLTGLGFAYARVGRGAVRVLGPIFGLLGGMALHAMWNGSLVAGYPLWVLALHWLSVVAMMVLIGVFLSRERRWMVGELNEEVGYGLLTADEVQRTCSVWRRFGTELGALFTGGPGSIRAKERFYRDCSELALVKHNMRTLGDDPKAVAEIQTLRARLGSRRARANA